MAERKPSDDRAAFGVFPQLKRNRSKQDREAAKNVPVDLARGFVSGVLGAPGDIESFARLPYELITGNESPTILPTSEDIEKRLPFRSDTPVSKAASGLGALGGGFYFGPGSPLKVIGALPGAVRHGAQEFAKASYAGAPNVVKREGGNWIENTIDNSIRGLKSNVSTENLANYTPEQVAQLTASSRLANNDAMNKWVENKIGRYVKSEMGTPSDPIRLMIEKREAEIADKFLKDQGRANRMAERAAQETDPRRKANLTRQAQRMLGDAVAQRDLAMEHTSHLPRGFQNVEANPASDSILESVRKGEGFPAEGMGTTPSSKAWERKADMSIYPINVGEIQSYPANKLSRQQAIEDYNAYEKTLDKNLVDYFKSKGLDDRHLAGLMKMSGEEKAMIVGDTKLKELLDAIPPYSPKEPIYELAGKESYISKLDPKSSVYSGDISGLHFDHIIDVLKQDLAARRITPEQLNKITMEQAVRRTADYDLERSVAMREAKIKQQEGFPVYKEYPDEGYKWLELTKPKLPDVLPDGWSDPVMKGNALQTKSPNGDIVLGTDMPNLIENLYKRHPETSGNPAKVLEDALKYEGDTMGHCVGGYCPDVLEGRTRIFSLRDSKGEPHVTVEVMPNPEAPKWDDVKPYMAAATEEAKNLPNGYTGQDISDIAIRMAKENMPLNIVQVKGKQNARPIDKYDQYTQDFVKSGNWNVIGDLQNTGLYKADPFELGMFLPKAPDLQDLPLNRGELLVRAQKAGLFPEGQKYLTRDEWEDIVRRQYQAEQQAEAARKAQMSKPPSEGDIQGFLGGLEPEMKRGGVVISNNPDAMMLELNNKRMKKGGSEDDTKPFFGGAGTKKYAAAKKRAEQADVNTLKDPRTYATVAGFFGERPDEMGFSVLHPDYQGVRESADPAFYAGTALGVAPLMKVFKAPAMALGRAGEKYAEKVVPQIMERGGVGADILGGLAQGTRSNVYLPHTPQKPDPNVGSRYKTQHVGNLAPKREFDIEANQDSSVMANPWDLTSRGEKVLEVSDTPMINPIVTEGGHDFARDLANIQDTIGGASGRQIAERMQDRVNDAYFANMMDKGSGRVFTMPSTMDYTGSNYSTMPTDVIMDFFKQAELKPKDVNRITDDLRTFMFETERGKFKNAAPVGSPDFMRQLREGGEGFSAGDLRKGFMDRMSKAEYQKMLGYNIEDVYAAIHDPALKGVPKGFVGNTMIETSPFAEIRPSTHQSYDSANAGKYAGSMPSMPIELMMPDLYEYLERQVLSSPKPTYKNMTPNQIRTMIINMIEKRGSVISQPINQRVVDNVMRYKEGLKQGHFKPNDYESIMEFMRRTGGYKDGGEVKKAEGGYLKKPAAYLNGDEFVNAAKKYGIKDSMNNLNKIVDLVNKGLSVDDAARQVADSGMHKAAGGAISGDDLILEERPL